MKKSFLFGAAVVDGGATRVTASMSSLMRPPSLARTTLWGRSMHGCPWNVHRMPVPKEWGLVTAHMSGGWWRAMAWSAETASWPCQWRTWTPSYIRSVGSRPPLGSPDAGCA